MTTGNIDVRVLIDTGDAEALAAAASSRFGASITADDIARAIAGYRPRKYERRSEGTWFSWLKNRLLAAGLLPAGASPPPDDEFSVTFHIGFVSICETEEQIALLRGDPSVVAEAKVARSKIIEADIRYIRPIDRVAARVTHD